MVLTTDKSITLEIIHNVILYNGKSAIKWQYPSSNAHLKSNILSQGERSESLGVVETDVFGTCL